MPQYGGGTVRGGYAQAQNEALNRRAMDMQNTVQGMGMISSLQKQQQEQQMRQALAQSGGDPEKAMQIALQSGNIAAIQTLAPIVNQRVQQQEAQRKRGIEEQGSAALAGLSPNATSDEVMTKLRQFLSPKDVYQGTQNAELKKTQLEQTKQIALQRLGQQIASEVRHAYEFAQTLPLKERQLALQEINSRGQKAYQAGQLQIAAGNLNYNTGADTGSIMNIVSDLRAQSMAPTAQTAQPVPNASASAGATIRADMPTDESAQAMAMQLAAQGQPVAIRGPQPSQAPTERQPTAYIQQPQESASTLVGGAGAPAMAPVAPQASAAPKPTMPQFGGSPRERQRAENQWRLQQSRTEASLGNMRASDAIVAAVVEGRMPLPTGFALKSPYWQDVIDRVANVNPNFDAGVYGARAAARRTFASGPEARNVTALNTVIGHLGTLDDAASKLDNGDIRLANAVFNRLATETGDPRIQNFDTAKQAVAEETMRVFRQVGASESEAKAWGERITSSGSPQQLRGVIATLGQLLESRIEAIGSQFERTVNVTGGTNPAVVDPKNKKRLGELIQQGKPKSNDYSRLWKK